MWKKMKLVRFPQMNRVGRTILAFLLCLFLLPACGQKEQPRDVAEQSKDISKTSEDESEQQQKTDQKPEDTSSQEELMVTDGESSTLRFVLTTGFNKDEVFQINESICRKPEMMLYLITMQNQYENVYGQGIWQVEVNGESLEESVKENALAKLAQVKTMDLMADSYGVTLTAEEMEKVDAIAKTFYESLSEKEISQMELDYDTVLDAYKGYALAQKIYQYVIKDINPEVSDDEARKIKVQHILIKTFAMDGTGKKISYTDNSKRKARLKAEEAQQLAVDGEDFDELVRSFGDNEVSTLSFGKGEMNLALEEAAFNLGKGEISDVIETEDGYEILRCISTFDKAETDANKLKIVEEKRKEVFGEKYDLFVSSLIRHLNKPLWKEIGFIHDDEVNTSDFFDLFEENM